MVPPIDGAAIGRRWTWRRAAGWCVLLAVCFRIAWTLGRDAALDPTGGQLRSGDCLVSEVFDDGTLEVAQRASADDASASRHFRVRMLGVRPMRGEDLEKPSGERSAVERFAEASRPADVELAATAWLRDATVGKSVRLEFDRRRFDEQGRWLAYVVADEKNLNVEWVRAGWARADSAPGDASAWRREIQRAEAEARRAARGGWRRDSPELVPPRSRG